MYFGKIDNEKISQHKEKRGFSGSVSYREIPCKQRIGNVRKKNRDKWPKNRDLCQQKSWKQCGQTPGDPSGERMFPFKSRLFDDRFGHCGGGAGCRRGIGLQKNRECIFAPVRTA